MENIFETQNTSAVAVKSDVVVYWVPKGFTSDAITSKNIDRCIARVNEVDRTNILTHYLIDVCKVTESLKQDGRTHQEFRAAMMEASQNDLRAITLLEAIDRACSNPLRYRGKPGSFIERTIIPKIQKTWGGVNPSNGLQGQPVALKLNARGEELLAQQQDLLADSIWAD